jgi:hypothetical protein
VGEDGEPAEAEDDGPAGEETIMRLMRDDLGAEPIDPEGSAT